MKRYLLFIFSLLLVITQKSYAQDTLGVGANKIIQNLSAVAQYGDSDSITFYIKNKGSAVFSGTVYVQWGVDTGSGLNFVKNLDTITLSGFNPGDSILQNNDIIYDTTNFRLGTNIVVIWPSAAGAVIIDSASGSIIINGYNSLIEIDANKKLIVYPNPTSDLLYVSLDKSSQTIINQLRLYDVSGKLIYSTATSSIDMRSYASGTYILMADFKDNTSQKYKITKE